jgi:hypothetical protein
MKRREGFVSNSSSSSFILGVNKNVNNEDIKIEITIEECIDKRISTIEEVKTHFVEYYGWADCTWEDILEDSGEWMESRYAECVECIENGQDIIFGTASNEADSAADLAIYFGALTQLDMDDVTVVDAGEC